MAQDMDVDGTWQAPDPAWELVDDGPAGRYYRTPAGLIVIAPTLKSVETGDLALSGLKLLRRFADEAGKPIRVAILMDRIRDQTPEARRVWSQEISPDWYAKAALVAESMLGRAITSFYLGLARPPVPTKVFATLALAFAWLEHDDA